MSLPSEAAARGGRLLAVGRGLAPALALILLCALFSLWKGGNFASPDNLRFIVAQAVITGIGAMGMTMIIVSGGIDLSVGSVLALSSVIGAQVLNATQMPIVAVAAALVCGAAVGVVNGAVISRLALPPFIVTLGMMGVARGLAKGLAREQVVYVYEAQRGIVPARNRGVQEARGQWLAFFDDDQLAEIDALVQSTLSPVFGYQQEPLDGAPPAVAQHRVPAQEPTNDRVTP